MFRWAVTSLVLAVLALAAPPARALTGGAAPGAFTCFLKSGSHGAKVRTVQKIVGVRADGAFGPGTARAVRGFQRRHRLAPTGCVDRATRAALGLVSQPARAKVALTAPELAALQRALGLEPDGVLGPLTRAAIRAAERAAGLPVDGVPSMQLLAALHVAVAPVAAAPASTGAAGMLRAALTRIGDPYVWGAAGPDRFDCSGLVMWAARAAGLTVPRTSFAQYATGTAVAADAIRPGDLVFFNTGGPGPSHVGIAVDATHTVSATSHGVREHATFDPYWGPHYVGAQRIG